MGTVMGTVTGTVRAPYGHRMGTVARPSAAVEVPFVVEALCDDQQLCIHPYLNLGLGSGVYACAEEPL